MNRERRVDRFVDSLAQARPPNDLSENVYRCATRRENLTRWLTSYIDSPSSAIFIGEAPGIKGARLTGIPFTSPAIMSGCESDPWSAFSPATGIRIPKGANAGQSESTATIFWKAMRRYFAELPRPMTWNAYPFWPHQEDGLKNRTPRDEELRFGHKWLSDIVEMHPKARIIAVGRKAEKALREIGFDAEYVRHPANGGASDFDEGVKRITDLLRWP